MLTELVRSARRLSRPRRWAMPPAARAPATRRSTGVRRCGGRLCVPRGRRCPHCLRTPPACRGRKAELPPCREVVRGGAWGNRGNSSLCWTPLLSGGGLRGRVRRGSSPKGPAGRWVPRHRRAIRGNGTDGAKRVRVGLGVRGRSSPALTPSQAENHLHFTGGVLPFQVGSRVAPCGSPGSTGESSPAASTPPSPEEEGGSRVRPGAPGGRAPHERGIRVRPAGPVACAPAGNGVSCRRLRDVHTQWRRAAATPAPKRFVVPSSA